MGFLIPKKNLFWSIVFCVLFTSEILAESCKKGCPKPDNGKLKYNAGSAYHYQFDSLISIGLPIAAETENDETSVQIQGLVKLFANGNCDYQVQLSNFQVKTQRAGVTEQIRKQFLDADLKDPLNFIWSNGELENNLCDSSNSKQSEYLLNLKRAVVSMLQSTDNQFETDIFGVCPSQRSEISNIAKTYRDLNSCAYRENFLSGFVQSIVNLKSGIKSSLQVKGDSIKTQKISQAGIFDEIELLEEYKFMPHQQFAAKKNSLSDPDAPIEPHFENSYVSVAKVRTTMKLSKTSDEKAAPISNGKEISIIYDNLSAKPIKNLQALKKSLAKTVSLLQGYTKFQSAKYFTEIIQLMRQADAETLIELSSAVGGPNKMLTRKVYLDALFRAGTTESIKALAKQIPKMNEKEKRIAFMSMMLVQDSVDKDTLKELSNLLSAQQLTEAYLSIGTLLKLYCNKNECNDNNNIFVEISQKFIDALRHCNAPNGNKKEETRIVGVLKGIRNTYKLSDRLSSKLDECAEPNKSARIRVAALQAFTASNCNDVLQKKALEILKDRSEDSEIRIEAYLALVHCPTQNLATDLAELLQTEEVNQVGTFLTTHLKSIRDSTDFTRSGQRYYLSNVRLPAKFPIDPRRFSFNSELSYALDSLGIGASTDLSVIYSQSGFLPRSVRWNLTTEVFGKSFNFIDLSARQENLEDILEYFFGPKGFFNQEPQQILDQITSKIERPKRSIADNTKDIFKSYKSYSSNKLHDLNFDLSLKLFGTEFGFLSMGDAIPTNTEDLIDLFGKIYENTKSGLKNYQKQFEYHTTLEDCGLRYPTGSGFPLELAEHTVLVGKIDFATEIDIDQNLSDPSRSKYRVKLVPSADLYSNFQFRLNAGLLSTGLIVDTNVYSAIGGDHKLELLHDTQGFHFNVDLPRNEIDLIEMKYNMNFFTSEQDKEMVLHPLNINQKRSKAGVEPKLEKCFDQLDEALGVQLCYIADVPQTDLDSEKISTNIEFPHTSPIHVGVKLKTERKLQFSGLYQYHQDHQSWIWIYDTPESQKPHKTQIKFDLGADPKVYVRLSLDNPKMQYAIETGLQNDDREFALYAKTEIDSEQKISKIGFTKSNGGREYHPLIHVQDINGVRTDIAGYKAGGRILVEPSPAGQDAIRYKFDNFRLIQPNNQQTVLNGWIDLLRSGLNAELSVQNQQKRYKVLGNLGYNEQKEISIGGYLIDEAKPEESTVGGKWIFQLSDNQFKNDLTLQVGIQKFHLLNKWAEGLNPNGNQNLNPIKFQNKIDLKENENIILAGKLNGEITDILYMIDFEAQRNDKLLGVLYKLSTTHKAPSQTSSFNFIDYNLQLNLKLNRHYIEIKSTSDLKQNQKYNLDTSLVTSWGTTANIKGDVQPGEPIQLNLNGNFKISKSDTESSFVIKAIGTKTNQNYEFKFKRNKIDLFQSSIDIQRANDKPIIGSLNIILKDNLNAKGDFKFNSKNGKGDLNLLINLMKKSPDQKIQLHSKFLFLSPKYDFDTTLQLNKNRKIHFKTENVLDCGDNAKGQKQQATDPKKIKFISKNLFELNQDKTQLDLQYLYTGIDFQYDSDIDSKFELQLPNNRKFTGYAKRQFNSNQQKGQLNIYLDETQANNQKRSLQWTGQLTDYNKKYHHFNVGHKWLYTKFDGKQIDIQLTGKNMPKNTKSKSDSNVLTQELKFIIGGSEFDKSKLLDLNIIFNEISQDHIIYTINGKYRDNYLINLIGNGYSNLNGKRPFSYETNMDLKLSNEKYLIKSNGKFLLPNDILNDNEKYDIIFKFDSQFPRNGKNENLNANIIWQGDSNVGTYKLNSNCPWHGKMSIDGNYLYKFNDDTNVGRTESKLNYDLGHYGKAEQEFSLNILTEDQMNINYKLKSNYNHLQQLNYDLKLRFFNDSVDPIDDKITIDSNLIINDNKYQLNSIIFTSFLKTGIDLKLQHPTYTTIILGTYEEKINPNKVLLNLNLKNLLYENDFDLLSKTDVTFKGNDLAINGNLNSMKFKLNQIQYELNMEDVGEASSTLKLKITKNSGKDNILSGQAQYRSKIDEKANDIQFQGSGNILYFKEEMNANFKLTRQQFTNNTHGEYGWSYQFNGKFGPKNLVSTVKVTNKDFHIKFVTCEESKQCTNFEIQSILRNNVQPQSDLQQHELMVLIDLRELKFPYEFELQIKTTTPNAKNALNVLDSEKFRYLLNHWENIAQEIEMNIISNTNHKYQLFISLKPEKCIWKLKLPKREIVLEHEEKFPDFKLIGDAGFNGAYEQKLTFYFDKLNKPKEKTQLTILGDVTAQQIGLAHTLFQMKFEHPTIRPISIIGTAEFNRQKQFAQSQIEFDIFKNPEQKIIGLAKAYGDINTTPQYYNYKVETKWMSNGLDFDYTTQANARLRLQPFEATASSLVEAKNEPNLKYETSVSAKRDSFDVSLNGLNYNIFKITGKIQNGKIDVNSQLQLSEQLKDKKILFSSELDLNGGKFELKRADNKFNAEGEFNLGKQIKFTVNGNQKNLLNAKVHLESGNFMKTESEFDDEHAKNFMHQIKEDLKADTEIAAKDLNNKFVRTKDRFMNRIQLVRDSLVDTKKLISNSEQNLNGIIKELEEDPSLKDIFESYRKIYNTLVKLTQQLIKTYTEFYDQMFEIYKDFSDNISKITNEKIIPELKYFIEVIEKNLSEFYKGFIEFLNQMFDCAKKAIGEFETNLKEFLKPIVDVLSPFYEVLVEFKKSIEKELTELLKELDLLYKKIPELINENLNKIRSKLKELGTLEDGRKILQEIFAQLEEFAITAELRDFIHKFAKYLDLKLTGGEDENLFNELIDSFVATLTDFYQLFVNGIKSESNFITNSYLSFIVSLQSIGMPFNADIFDKFPVILTSVNFSFLNYITNENIKGILGPLSDSNNNYKSADLLPPYELKAHIAGGQHFFTFDNRHFTFPGQKQCKYILSQDSINNNFTVVANYNDNLRLQSIQLFDQMAENNMELFSNGQLKLNGKSVEYPIHEGNLHAWRRYYTVTMLSEYGVEVKCTTDLNLCHLIVNGFYTSKLRGLMGNANAEQYDDFIQPNGKIENNYADFGNKYALGNCQPVTVNQKLISHLNHHHSDNVQAQESTDICSELFGYNSNFVLGYIFIDYKPYREACQHAISIESTQEKKLEAACNIALTYASTARLEHLALDMPDICLKCGEHDIGTSREYKIPTNSADIVLILDTKVDNQIRKELLQPVIQDLRVQLKQRGLTDINLAVIAYNEDEIYPGLITSGHGKLNYNGNINDIKLDGPKQFHTLFTDLKHDKLNEWLNKLQTNARFHESEMEAYIMALEYPFRPEAAKSIISIRSYYTNDDLVNVLGATLSDIYLQTTGVQFHLIAPIEIVVEGVPSEKIVGFNKRVVATIDGKDQKKREKLKYNLFNRIDSGWVFALQNFDKLKTPEHKTKFIHQISTGIADQMYKTEITQKCDCSIEYGLHGQHDCFVLTNQFVQTKKVVPAAKG